MTKRKRLSQDYGKERDVFAELYNLDATQALWDKLDSYQRVYASAMDKYEVVFTDAVAGTGKTTIAVLKALDYLRRGKVKRIAYVRFPDSRSLRMGFLTGDKEEKESGYMVPFYDAMIECGVQPSAVDLLRTKEVIELTTDIHMRGRNLKDTFLIIDEAQNSQGIEDLQLVLTRIHDDGGRAVVIGHSKQVDGKIQRYGKQKLNAFQVYQYHFTKKSWAAKCELPNNYRGKISQWADKVWESVKELEE